MESNRLARRFPRTWDFFNGTSSWWSRLNVASGIYKLVHFVRTKLEDGYLSVKNEETRAEKLVVLDIVQSVVEVLHSDFELSSSCDR